MSLGMIVIGSKRSVSGRYNSESLITEEIESPSDRKIKAITPLIKKSKVDSVAITEQQKTLRKRLRSDSKSSRMVKKVRSSTDRKVTQLVVRCSADCVHIPPYDDVQGPDPMKIEVPASKVDDISGDSNQELISRHFEEIKPYKSLLEDFLHSIPKGAENHFHLTGALRPIQWLNLAIKKKLYINPETFEFTSDKRKGIPAKRLTLEENHDLYEAFENAYSMINFLRDNKQASAREKHNHFFKCFNIIDSIYKLLDLSDILEVIIDDDLANKIFLHEIMLDFPTEPLPKEYIDEFDENNLEGMLKKLQPWIENYTKNAKKIIDECDERLQKKLNLKGSISQVRKRNFPIIKLILEVMKTENNPKYFALLAASIELCKQHSHIVTAFTTDDEENAPSALINRNTQKKFEEFLIKKRHNVNYNPHAGELTIEYCSPSDMKDAISSKISMATRIGHGLSIPRDGDKEKIFRKMKGGIPVEVCPTSSKEIYDIPPQDHPFKLYWENEVPILICSDDPGILGLDIVKVYVLAVQGFDLTYRQLITLIRNSLEYSYLKGTGIYRREGSYTELKEEFKRCKEPTWIPNAKAKKVLESEKAGLELFLEQQIYLFEQNVLKKIKKSNFR